MIVWVCLCVYVCMCIWRIGATAACKTSVCVLVGSIPASEDFIWIDGRVGKCRFHKARVAGSSLGLKDKISGIFLSSPIHQIQLSYLL